MGLFNKATDDPTSPFRRGDTVKLKEIVDETSETLPNGNLKTVKNVQEVYKGFIITDTLTEETRPDGTVVNRRHLRLGKSLTDSAEKVFRKIEKSSNSVYALESERQVNQLLLSYSNPDSVQ